MPGVVRNGERHLPPWALPATAVAALTTALIVLGITVTDQPPPATQAPLPVPPYLTAPFAPVTQPGPPPPDDLPQPGTTETSAGPGEAGSAEPPDRDEPGEPDQDESGGAGQAEDPEPDPDPRPTTTPPRPEPGPVSGRYRVVDSFPDGFIGEVLVANTAAEPRAWTVRLQMSSTIGPLVTSWVESAPQATLTQNGRTFVWRSGVPVPPGSTVPLRFHLNRSATDELPASCTVNGAPCSGLA